MRRPDRAVCWARLACCLAALPPAVAAAADDTLLRYRAEIVVERPAAFVKLGLPASVYARSEQPGLQDLRVVDARGERVPFALLVPQPDEPGAREQERAATIYPLPPRPPAGTAWPAPVELTVEADRIHVKRRGGVGAAPPARSPGWLIDLGDLPRGDPRPHALRLQWSGPSEFSAGYSLDTGDDLRAWRDGGRGQVMALAGSAGALTQPIVPLPEPGGRFVRLVWSDPSAAPLLSAASAVTRWPGGTMLEAPTELLANTSAEPVGLSPPAAAATDSPGARRVLHFDLGAPLPLVEIDLELAVGTQVVPVQVQARSRSDEAWLPIAGAVFYRFESGGQERRSPPLGLQRTVRYVRVVPDERSAPLDPTQTRLRVRAQLSSLVFAAQGAQPYALLAGSRQATPGALPLATLVPALDEERARFGRGALGAWQEVEPAARRAEADERRAALRPWLLWSVLLAGVAGLAFMVWRLARGGRSGSAGPPQSG